LAVALLCGGSKKHLHQGGLSTDQLLPLSYEKISAVDRSDLSDYTYVVLGGAESDEYSSSHAVKLRLYGFPQGAARFACFPLATARKWCQSLPRRGS